MADNLQYPQDTYSGGSSVMSATDSEGAKWSYDNDAGKWVNLTTGNALSPAEFSDHAGRGGNAAQGTMALAQAMKQEEASLMPPPRPAAPPPDQASMAQGPAMSAPVAPPQTGTQPMPQASMMPPGVSTITPPQNQIDPAYRQRLMAQQPVPSTRTEPSPAAIQAYSLGAYQKAVSMGMDKKAALQTYLPQAVAAQLTARPMTEYQRAQDDHRKWLENQASKKVIPPKTTVVTGVGLVDAATGQVIRAIPQTQTVSQHIPKSDAVPGTPAQPASKGFLGFGAHPAVAAVPGTPAQDAQTITRKVPVEAPASESSSANEIARKTKDGRVAIYDAKTKKFLRYDDNAQ